MPTVTVQLETPIRRTFRVEQVAGMLDVPLEERFRGARDSGAEGGEPWFPEAPGTTATLSLRHSLTAEVPGLDEDWTIGAIVGPSGSGKTTLARAAFGEAVWKAREWPREAAIVEVLGGAPKSGREGEGETGRTRRAGMPITIASIKEIARVLTAVGLGSVPTWLKPYRVLSMGERFRAELARAIQESGVESQESARKTRLLVFDEFTSSLDRTVARTTSAALTRMLNRADSRLRFVAVTCHSDILPWLAPDWVVHLGNPAGPRLIRQRPKPPEVKLRIEGVPQAMWATFARHHYLAGGLAASATCYGAFWEGEAPVAFCAVVAALGWKKTKRITRLVSLPEFQGLGVGTRLMEEVAAREQARGNRVTITASHPAVLAHCSNSASWRYLGVKKNGSTRQRMNGREVKSSVGRAVASFEFIGE